MTPSNHCILIAEDDEILRYTMTRHLVQRGFYVIEAYDGPSAMQREAEYDGAIHVLVTDVKMPGFDGHVLGRKIKEKRPEVKVIIVSGEKERDFPPEARSHDFALLKPVTPERLAAKLSELFEGGVSKASVRRSQELRLLASEGMAIKFESPSKARIGPLCIWIYAGRWSNERSGQSGRISSLSMRDLITRFL